MYELTFEPEVVKSYFYDKQICHFCVEQHWLIPNDNLRNIEYYLANKYKCLNNLDLIQGKKFIVDKYYQFWYKKIYFIYIANFPSLYKNYSAFTTSPQKGFGKFYGLWCIISYVIKPLVHFGEVLSQVINSVQQMCQEATFIMVLKFIIPRGI